ncbi:PHP domain-containing protein, partial [Aquisphaera insulae]|uniref:PHP domain-containing protein n=1 Tax=Aquisphaera insulae TaxID=2712864 RepID=UPI0013EBE38D
MLQAFEKEILAHSKGAEFRRADLHIHSYGQAGSYDVKDASMTPENIVDAAIRDELHVISITDHNAIGNVAKAVSYSEDKPLLVVPGVELSTPQGHLLVYFPTVRNLTRFYGQLQISDDGKSCAHTLIQCLNIACSFDGIGIAAHIDQSAGFEFAMPKYDAFKEELLKCKNLLALEITDIANVDWFTERDTHPNRKHLHGVRQNHLGEDETYELPKVMSSDAHSLTALGRNAQGARKLTRFKMETLNFDSLRIALNDASARTRIEDLIPSDIPHFVAMKLEGGLLDNQVVHFSRNLTCIIGGRGAGKSTLLECLRAVSGNAARENLVDCEIWPNRISLVYQDQTRRRQVLSRTKLNQVVNLSDANGGITRVPIESYGQGETAETIQHCDEDPTILLTFLDGFIDLEHLKARDEELCELLLSNQTDIERLYLDVRTIPDIERAKTNAEAQVKLLKEKEAQKVVELEEKIAKGKSFRSQLAANISVLFRGVNDALSDTSVADLILEADGSDLVVGSQQFGEVKAVVQEYLGKIVGFSKAIREESDKFTATLNDRLQRWVKEEAEAQQQIEDIRRELEAKGVKLNIAYIRKITKDLSDYALKLKTLEQKKAKLTILRNARRKLVEERRKVKSLIFTTRSSFAVSMNKSLKMTVVDYAVTMKFKEGTLSSDFEDLLKTAMGWRTSQIPR